MRHPGDGRRGFADGVAFACLLLFGGVRFVAWEPPPLQADLEGSWIAVLHEAWAQGWSFGTELVFTYGPYGFVDVRMLHPATYGVALALQLLLLGVMALALWALLAPRLPAVGAALLGAVVLELLLAPREGFYYALLLLPVLLEMAGGDAPPSRARLVLLHVTVLAGAFAGLTKFSFLLGFAAVQLVLAADALLRRRPPWPLATALLGLVALWLLAGQPLAALPAYLKAGLELSAGYTEAMSLAGGGLGVVVYLASGGLLVGAVAALGRPLGAGRAPLFALAFAALLAIAFKAAFLRPDWHTAIGWAVVAPLALLVGVQARAAGRVAATRAAGAALLLAAPFALHAYTRGSMLEEHYSTPPSALPRQVMAMGRALTGRFDVEAAWQDSLRQLNQRFPLPRLEGSVDLVPHYQGLLLAAGLDYRPRPVFQSQLAFTPGLSARNRRFFEGPTAPRSVLLALTPIDERYPTLDESLSLPVLLTHYAPDSVFGDHLVLVRADAPLASSLRSLGATRARLGDAVEVPVPDDGALVWAEIDLRPTPVGRLGTLLFRTPAVMLVVEQRNGVTHRHRLVPALARAGFLLSPRPAGPGDFARLRSAVGRAALDGQRIAKLWVETEGPAAWQPDLELRFHALELGPASN